MVQLILVCLALVPGQTAAATDAIQVPVGQRQLLLDDYYPDKAAVCLAVLRRDGFLSLDAGEEAGTVLTRPLVLAGPQLFVNVDAGRGTLEITVVDGDGKTLAVAKPVTGDKRAMHVEWSQGDPAALVGKPVRLRFTLRRASFYSFWLDT